ncbi:MAG TPA: hypothetical protein PKD55_05310 [Bellilinea sp.]|nr:hypothetical protein [Bellilinea sp.]
MNHLPYEKWMEDPESLNYAEKEHITVCEECKTAITSWETAQTELYQAVSVKAPGDFSNRFAESLAFRKRKKYMSQVFRAGIFLALAVTFLSVWLGWWVIQTGAVNEWISRLVYSGTTVWESLMNIPFVLSFWFGKYSFFVILTIAALLAVWIFILLSTTGFFTYRVYKMQGVRDE